MRTLAQGIGMLVTVLVTWPLVKIQHMNFYSITRYQIKFTNLFFCDRYQILTNLYNPEQVFAYNKWTVWFFWNFNFRSMKQNIFVLNKNINKGQHQWFPYEINVFSPYFAKYLKDSTGKRLEHFTKKCCRMIIY